MRELLLSSSRCGYTSTCNPSLEGGYIKSTYNGVVDVLRDRFMFGGS